MSDFQRRGGPTLSSVKDLPVAQDGPPAGGFSSIRFGKRIPNPGIRGSAFFAGSVLVLAYGWYGVRQGRKGVNANQEEKLAIRRVLHPVVEAEDDRRIHAATMEWEKMEKKIMSAKPGWEIGKSPYNHEHPTRYFPPNVVQQMTMPPADRKWDFDADLSIPE